MTILQHPSDETLMRHAMGAMAVGPGIVLDAHLEACPACRARLRGFDAVGGAMLDRVGEAGLKPDALADALSRIDTPQPLSKPPAAPQIGDLRLPAALRGCHIGGWWPVAPGMRVSRIRVPAAPKTNLVLFRVQAGCALPSHGHSGPEYIQVLTGAFHDGIARYAAGDLSEADGEIDHQPVTDGAGECISLAAVEGRTRMHGWLAKLIQPFVGL